MRKKNNRIHIFIACMAMFQNQASATGETTRVSLDWQGHPVVSGYGYRCDFNVGYFPVISADGRFVAFMSGLSYLVPGGSNETLDYGGSGYYCPGSQDIYLHDRQAQTTKRVSVNSDGVTANSRTFSPAMSADGRYTAFVALSTNLVANDTNYKCLPSGPLPSEYQPQTHSCTWDYTCLCTGYDVFVHNHTTGQTTRVSVDPEGNEFQDTNNSNPSLSADGRWITFVATEYALLDSGQSYASRPARQHIFVYDRKTGKSTKVKITLATQDYADRPFIPYDLSISADGRFIFFSSNASDLVPDDTNYACHSISLLPPPVPPAGVFLVCSGRDIFVYDRETDQTKRVSIDVNGKEFKNSGCSSLTISADGRYIAYEVMRYAESLAMSNFGLYLHDRHTGETEQLNLSSTSVGHYHSLSADGRFLAFSMRAPDSGNSNLYKGNVFVYDVQTRKTALMSKNSLGVEGNNDSYYPAISADGRVTAFGSVATNLDDGPPGATSNIYVRERRIKKNQLADISVEYHGKTRDVGAGEKNTLVLVVKNHGPDPATGVHLIDVLPSGFDVQAINTSQGECTLAPVSVCQLGTLPADASAKVCFTLKRQNDAGELLRNIATVNAEPVDPKPENNRSRLRLVVR